MRYIQLCGYLEKQKKIDSMDVFGMWHDEFRAIIHPAR